MLSVFDSIEFFSRDVFTAKSTTLLCNTSQRQENLISIWDNACYESRKIFLSKKN